MLKSFLVVFVKFVFYSRRAIVFQPLSYEQRIAENAASYTYSLSCVNFSQKFLNVPVDTKIQPFQMKVTALINKSIILNE